MMRIKSKISLAVREAASTQLQRHGSLSILQLVVLTGATSEQLTEAIERLINDGRVEVAGELKLSSRNVVNLYKACHAK